MTLVRANARLAGLDTGQMADVDLDLPLWANRVRTGLVSIVGAPSEPPASAAAPDAPLTALVRTLNADDTIALADTGGYLVADVRDAELEGRARKTVLAGLERVADEAERTVNPDEGGEAGDADGG